MLMRPPGVIRVVRFVFSKFKSVSDFWGGLWPPPVFYQDMKISGYTFIEILVVMATIGVLAVTVLALLKPMEQIRKSRDSRRMADARELVNGLQRYYLNFKCYPWENRNNPADCLDAGDTLSGVNPRFTDNIGDEQFGDLFNQGEMKSSYANRSPIIKNEFFITENGSENSISVCFEPESQMGRTGALGETRDKTDSAISTGCQLSYGGNGLVDCFVCVK